MIILENKYRYRYLLSGKGNDTVESQFDTFCDDLIPEKNEKRTCILQIPCVGRYGTGMATNRTQYKYILPD
jgi:hypothetical protein